MVDESLAYLLRAADNAASMAHDFIYGRNGVTQQQASDAIWTIHNALRPLFEDDPEPIGRLPGALHPYWDKVFRDCDDGHTEPTS